MGVEVVRTSAVAPSSGGTVDDEDVWGFLPLMASDRVARVHHRHTFRPDIAPCSQGTQSGSGRRRRTHTHVWACWSYASIHCTCSDVRRSDTRIPAFPPSQTPPMVGEPILGFVAKVFEVTYDRISQVSQ